MNSFLNYTFEIGHDEKPEASREGKLDEIIPTQNNFKDLLQKVGGHWGWDRRPQYLDPDLTDRRLYLMYMPAIGTVGYALTHLNEIENFGLFPEHTGKGLG
jgi:hypothetical protein